MSVPAKISDSKGFPLKLRSKKAQTVAKIFGTLGLWEAVTYAADNIGETLESIYDSMFESGAKPEVVANSMPRAKQAQIMAIELAKSGVEVDSSILAKILGEKVSQGYVQTRSVLANNEVIQAVDSAQTEVVGKAESDDVTRLEYIREMSDVCNILGLTGPGRFRELYRVSLIVNTIRKIHVDDAEQHERILGLIR